MTIKRPTTTTIAEDFLTITMQHQALHPHTHKLAFAWLKKSSPDNPERFETAMGWDAEWNEDKGDYVYKPNFAAGQLAIEIDQGGYRVFINDTQLNDLNYDKLHRARRGIMPIERFNEMMGSPKLFELSWGEAQVKQSYYQD